MSRAVIVLLMECQWVVMVCVWCVEEEGECGGYVNSTAR